MKYLGTLYAIDPGTNESAYVRMDDEIPTEFRTIRNTELLYSFRSWQEGSAVIIEKMSHYGKMVGDTTFDTIHWTGRFHQEIFRRLNVEYLTRPEVKSQLLGNSRCKDSDVSHELKQRFGQPGKKASPGILYGMKGHEWQALGVAVAWLEIWKLQKLGEKPIHEEARVGI